MRRKVIFCVINSVAAGGAEKVFQLIARHVDRTQFSVQICVLRSTPYDAAVVPSDVRLHYLADGTILSRMTALVRLIRLVREHRPDMLMAALFAANIMALIVGRLTATPVIVSEHGPLPLYLKDYPHGRVRSMLMRVLYGAARWIIVVSESSRQGLTSLYPSLAPLVQVIPNGIDVDDIEQRREAPQTIIAGDYVVSCGRLAVEKDFLFLIEVVACLNRMQGKDMALCIVGEGPQRSLLQTHAARCGVSLVLPGYLNDPYAVITAARLFVVTSRYESFSMSSAEAMVCGVPVVALVAPGGMQELLRDGINCKMSVRSDAVSVAAMCSSILADGAATDRLVVRAKQDVRERFHVKTMVQAYQNLWRNV